MLGFPFIYYYIIIKVKIAYLNEHASSSVIDLHECSGSTGASLMLIRSLWFWFSVVKCGKNEKKKTKQERAWQKTKETRWKRESGRNRELKKSLSRSLRISSNLDHLVFWGTEGKKQTAGQPQLLLPSPVNQLSDKNKHLSAFLYTGDSLCSHVYLFHLCSLIVPMTSLSSHNYARQNYRLNFVQPAQGSCKTTTDTSVRMCTSSLSRRRVHRNRAYTGTLAAVRGWSWTNVSMLIFLRCQC